MKLTDQQLQATEDDIEDMKQRITSNEGAVEQAEEKLDVCAEKTENLEKRLNSMEEAIRATNLNCYNNPCVHGECKASVGKWYCECQQGEQHVFDI